MPAWVVPAILAAISAASALGGKKTNQVSSQELGQMTAEDFERLLQIPEVQDFFKLQQAQALRLEPLQQATSQLAFQLLPIHARQGIDFWRVPTPAGSTWPAPEGASGSANPQAPASTPAPINAKALTYDEPYKGPPRRRGPQWE